MPGLLIANHGEIAIRVAWTARAPGYDVTTVHSVDDAGAPHARFAALVAASYDRGKAISVACVLEIDAVIDPADTRAWLRRGLASAEPGPSGRFVDAW